MTAKLSGPARVEALASIPLWREDMARDGILRVFTFPDFARAFAFMTEVARLAEEMNHHPDWSNSYNRVEIALSSHDIGGLSQRDIRLARAIDALPGVGG